MGGRIFLYRVHAGSTLAVVGDREAGRFLLPEIDLCGGPLTVGSGISDHVEDPAFNCDILPHRAGGGGASSEGRAVTL